MERLSAHDRVMHREIVELRIQFNKGMYQYRQKVANQPLTEIGKLMKTLRDQQWTYQMIADYLNENEIFSEKGKKWTRQNVVVYMKRRELA